MLSLLETVFRPLRIRKKEVKLLIMLFSRTFSTLKETVKKKISSRQQLREFMKPLIVSLLKRMKRLK